MGTSLAFHIVFASCWEQLCSFSRCSWRVNPNPSIGSVFKSRMESTEMGQKLTAFASKLGMPFSAGAVAGAVATVPMTLFMLLLQRMLPQQRHRALPPEKIVNALTRRIGARKRLDKEQRLGVAFASHFGYGASMRTLYIPFRRRVPLPPILKGAAFGLVVWVESYLGLLPALQLPPAAPREPLTRNLMMIASHLVWGTVMGVVAERLMPSGTQ
jgi:putative membrane protein